MIFPNGTMIGALSYLLSGRSDIALNGRLIDYLETDLVEFVNPPLNFEQIVFMVPRAEHLPLWMVSY